MVIVVWNVDDFHETATDLQGRLAHLICHTPSGHKKSLRSMQALVLDNGLSYRNDYPTPSATDNEALIRVRLAGICATDLELIKGYAGFAGILGHEFVGVVEAVTNEQHRQWVGRRVVGSINIGCGRCDVCLNHGPEHCQQRRVLGIRGKNGAFADYLTLPIENLYAVSDTIDDEAAVFTEPLAAAVRVVKQLAHLSIDKIGVIGPGRLGLLIAKTLAIHGYEVDVIGRTQTTLTLAKQWQLSSRIVETVADNQYPCVVDATGTAQGFKQALRILGPRGTLILKSTFSSQEPIDLSKIVVYELNVIGSRCGPFADALPLLEQRRIAVTDLIEGSYPLQNGIAALQHASQPGVRKILLYS